MPSKKAFKVKHVAQMTGVSVRTLHYYDEIGLLTPENRTAAGYRLYGEEDLLRLQQILIGRSLGLSLEDVRRGLDDPGFDYAKALQRQRAELVERIGKTHDMIAAIDKTLDGLGESKLDFKQIFQGFDPEEFEEEAEERWGQTDAYAQSARRTKSYTEADWKEMKAELAAIWSDGALAMDNGLEPSSEAALSLVERHRAHICRWFYDLDSRGHVGLADMWEADDRFRANIDKYGEGLTDWFAAAVRAAGEAV